MTTYRLLTLCSLLLSTSAMAQLLYPTGVINVNTTRGVGIVEQVQPLPEIIENSLYLDESWGNLIFSTVENESRYKYPGRIDILNDRVEFKDSEILKTIQGQFLDDVLLESFEGKSRYFVRNTRFKNFTEAPSGFYEVMNEGAINVLKHLGFMRLEPSYNPALDVGNRTPEIRRADQLYILKNNELIELPKKKKEIYRMLGPSAERIARNKSLNPKDEFDLIVLINELNIHEK